MHILAVIIVIIVIDKAENTASAYSKDNMNTTFFSQITITIITIITIITVKNGHPLSASKGSILYIFKYKYIKNRISCATFQGSRIACAYFGCNYCNYCNR